MHGKKNIYTNHNLQLGSLSISWSSEVHTFGTQAAQKLLVQHNHEGQPECVDQQRKSPQTLMDDHTQEVASYVDQQRTSPQKLIDDHTQEVASHVAQTI